MSSAEKANILVVDDLPDKLLVLRSVLEQLDQNVITARSGEEALLRVLGQDFAVILLDVNMPGGMDGFETAGLIRRRKKSAHTPIIFITAFSDELHTAKGYSLGAVDYILSPIVPEVLRTKVSVFVDLYLMTREVRRQAEERVALVQEQAARAAAEEATRRSTFLAEASKALAGSLEPETTFRQLVRLVVPFMADISAVVPVDERGQPGTMELARHKVNAAREQVNGAGEQVSGASRSAGPASGAGEQVSGASRSAGPASGAGEQAATVEIHTLVALTSLPDPLADAVGRAMLSRRPENLSDPPGDADAGRARFSLGPWTDVLIAKALVLPLVARNRLLGVLVLVRENDQTARWADLPLAEDLAGRAAIALDNARLHQNIQAEDRRKDEFLAMLAHELRNPLAPIRNAVELMRRMGPDAEVLQQARDMVDRQVTHMGRIIDDLLDVSRLSRGKILLRHELVDLARLVQMTAEDYRAALEGHGLRLLLQVGESGPLYVYGDPTRLAQVVGNVLNNAGKFTEPGGEIRVVLTQESDGQVKLSIRDSGIGIEPDMLPRVFDPFSQADRSLDRSRGGLGLGLTLVKRLIELHKGEVRISSAGLGQGTEVCIVLPAARAPATAEAPPRTTNHATEALRILIIEDNQDAAESMRCLLAMVGHKVTLAVTGAEGVQRAREFQPDVVLCDIGLPGGMDGYEVARLLRGEPASAAAYLIAATGYGQPEDQRRAREAGFDVHLTKPVDFDILLELVAKRPPCPSPRQS